MKPNINDVSNLQNLKRALTDKNVSATAIATIERALKKGMSFQGAEDLKLLSIPNGEAGAIGDLVTFGTSIVIVKNLKTIEFRFEPNGEARHFFGYQLLVSFNNKNGFTVEQSYPIEDSRLVLVDIDLNQVPLTNTIRLRVNSAEGIRCRIRLRPNATPFEREVIEIPAGNLANATIDVEVKQLALLRNPKVSASYPVKGKLIAKGEDLKLEGYQIILYATAQSLLNGSAPSFSPVAFATTETNGYFLTTPLLFPNPADLTGVTAAKAAIVKGEKTTELSISLVVAGIESEPSGRTSMIPERLILVLESEPGVVAAQSNDCGCQDLNFHQKKVLEEYSYYTVVRTTEPSIIADVLEEEKDIDLQDIYGVSLTVPLSVFNKYHAIQSRQLRASFLSAPISQGATASGGPRSLALTANTPSSLFNPDLMNRLIVDYRVQTIVQGNEKPAFKGRMHLGPKNQIDWDDEPTIYQAASIAHGHLLHFKQEWMPDGYSIGDLVYSLPLAPGQKKQIAVLDWERRESSARSEANDYEETLNNSLARDRDVSEIVSGTLTENLTGRSKATNGGLGFGYGSSLMGVIPGVGTVGSLLGISGGISSSGSSASQNSRRESTANSLQSISDRTQQAASVVRSQRATVVQTVSQGERVQATAESVANYNHCHAITIQYFEVLRHFAIRTRLAGVQECLFVPLQFGPFDLKRCLRWRNTLERHVYQRGLRAAFAAVERIQNERESFFENYYDSIGYPRNRFAEQPILDYSGELFLEFVFFNTNEGKINDEIAALFKWFGIPLDHHRDRQITSEELASEVGPRAVEFLLDAFTIETDKGVDLKLDLTLVSRFRQGVPLRVSVRQSATTPVSIAREQISAINIKLDMAKFAQSPSAPTNLDQLQNKYMKIRLRSGNLRYRTSSLSGTLIKGTIDNDIFANGDGAYMVAPLTPDELRNPRGEDVEAANNLIHHLNENLEYYNKCMIFDMTPERRFMLLDGIIAPGKANGRSVASVVENRVIGVVGNSMVMPVAPGFQLDPTIDETFDMFAQYFYEDPEPMRVSVATKGIYAEAVMGKCNSCEEKDESRFWRWEESPIPDSPTTSILPLSTDTRRADPGNLEPKDFPASMVNIQNAPNLPDPSGLQKALDLLGTSNAFRDVAGLNQTQLSALAAYQKSLDTAQAFGKEAADLAKTAAMLQMVKDAQRSGTLSNDDAKKIARNSLQPDSEKEREQTQSDIDQIDQAKQNNQIDEGRGWDLTADLIRARKQIPGMGSDKDFVQVGGKTPQAQALDSLYHWRDLLLFKIPDEIKTYLDGRGFRIQYAHEESYSNDLSFDFYAVKIDRYPTIDGQLATAQSLSKFIRTNLTQIIDSSFGTFEPYDVSIDAAKWQSDNPLKAALLIDVLVEEAAVAVTKTSRVAWTFSTIETPKSGAHPVSGHRHFYFTKMQDSQKPDSQSDVFVVRGLDMASRGIAGGLLGYPIQSPAYFGADRLWRALQAGLAAFINSEENGGRATVLKPRTHLVPWRQVYARYGKELERVFGPGAGSSSSGTFFDL